jgi:serine/threonine protein kinase
MLGERVAGRFELEALAQAGGMGAVYRARDLSSGEAVAVKLLRSPGVAHEARFAREAALLAALPHPAIVRHVAHGRTAGGDLYLAMEWLEGEDLASRLTRGPLAVDEALGLSRRIAEGLAALHARGVVHRDLKPGNLFLVGGRADAVKILDFGIARAGAVAAITRTGVLMGTPGYTAPEQARGAREIDARVDVFALGCVLFECLAGRPAFSGDHVMAVLAKILLEEPPRLGELGGQAPPELDALVARLMAKEPDGRPRDAGEVLALLDALAAGAAGRAITTPTPRPMTLTSDEQRFMTLIVCADVGAATAGAVRVSQLPTLAETQAPLGGAQALLGVDHTLVPGSGARSETVAALVRAQGGRLEPMVDGS